MTAAYPSVPVGRTVPQAGPSLWRQLTDAIVQGRLTDAIVQGRLTDAIVQGRKREAADFMTQYSSAHAEYRE
jgi:hypothetical protein